MLTPRDKMPQPEKEFFPRPPKREDGSYIYDLQSGAVTPMRLDNGVYKLDAWVRPHRKEAEGFGRREP